MTEAGPRSVTDLDKELRDAISGYHRLRWIAVTVLSGVVFVVIAVLIITVISQQLIISRQQRIIDQLRVGVTSSCSFYKPLAIAPVKMSPPLKRPSQFLVQIIIGARLAYGGEGCGGLPPASPSLRHWAAYYHLRA